MTTCDLYVILEEELQSGSSDLVTRQSGKVIREKVERHIEKEDVGAVIALDFSNIGIIDYSCADEIVAKLISRLLGGEYGDKYITLTGINDNQKENIEVALERKNLALMAEMRNGEKVLLGKLNNYLKDTLQLIVKKSKVSSMDLASTMKLEANTSGTRLLNLHKKRLVKRSEAKGSGGRIWVYELLY